MSEIKEIESDFAFTSDESPWLQEAVTKLDENTDLTALEQLSPARKAEKPRSVSAEFSAHQVDGVVVLNGEVNTHVRLLCSRCATPFELACNPHFTAMYSKDPHMAGVRLSKHDEPRHTTRGLAKSQHESMDRDLDITYLTEDFIDVSQLVTEQVQLQVPFQPLCEEDCKGICANCGADLNHGRCACNRLERANPFTALKDMKLGSR